MRSLTVSRAALIAPAIALLALLLLALWSLITASVVVPGGPWYANYRKFLGDDLFVAYVYRSFRVAALTTRREMRSLFSERSVRLRPSIGLKSVLVMAPDLHYIVLSI